MQIATIEAERINLIRINKCLQVVLELTGAVALKVVPLIKEVISCVNFQHNVNTESLSMTQLLLLIYQFTMHALNNKVNCLMNAYMAVTEATNPHMERLRALKCAYLLVREPLC